MTWLHSEKSRLEAVATRCLVLPPGEDQEHRSAPRTSSWTLPSSSRQNGSCRRWRATRRDKLRSSAASPNSLASTAQLTYLTALLAGRDAEPDQEVALAGPVAQEGHPVTAVHVAARGQHGNDGGLKDGAVAQLGVGPALDPRESSLVRPALSACAEVSTALPRADLDIEQFWICGT